MTRNWITVVRTGELEPGCPRLVDVNGTRIAVFCLEGAYYALEDLCTHDGGELVGGEIRDGWIECLRHGARFCIKTGAPLFGPAFHPVPKFPVRVEQGEVQVRDARWSDDAAGSEPCGAPGRGAMSRGAPHAE